MSEPSPVERELAIRLAAAEWLNAQRTQGAELWSQKQLAAFEFAGQRVPLMDLGRGIRKPAGMTAALSMRTVYRREGAERPYEDAIGVDGLWRYLPRRDTGGDSDNRAMREAMRRGLPLIWFYGVAPALYTAIYPVYILAEEHDPAQFVLALTEEQRGVSVGDIPNTAFRAYVERITRQRLHQSAFRAVVMRAYETRCAVCSFGHGNLLDAAHITPDSTPDGLPVVSNGLALCKIHHAAYDANILGIRPDLTIHVRSDVLAEVDGPMLRHGIQAHHDQPLMVVPPARRDRPAPDRITQRYEQFLAA